ncbi:small fragment nuclease isoform X2 [Archocentrus centrarchus]|uniref:small fragment nuclease isoform X2 n=1 Tax=Archocentrus centrarchus TaxID=63155 RepID=UPI0011EA4077|nr:oligoribonuclease, mitochondrial isoform X2 [Archocentrus centrarchus]
MGLLHVTGITASTLRRVTPPHRLVAVMQQLIAAESALLAAQTGSRLSMPVFSRSGAWLRAALFSPHSRSAFRLTQPSVSRARNPFVAPGTASNASVRPGGVFAVQAASRMSASSPEMWQRMVWVDLEMTGLDIEKDQIIEMACIITDSDLNVLAESGLTQAVRDSKISLEQAEYEFLSFVRQHTPPGHCPLAGNSVHADKRFLDKYMPQFMYHLHYRIIDVSTIKELSRRWFPEEYKMVPHKKATHRALDDIWESIKELRHYRANIFKESAEKKSKIVENGASNTS